ncbi:MAG TPA: SBBP repeat-containing protein [Bryobacteraceae bacterium]|nr:SBBP repeat-containing protein [Bryobacteraceae bacterium]
MPCNRMWSNRKLIWPVVAWLFPPFSATAQDTSREFESLLRVHKAAIQSPAAALGFEPNHFEPNCGQADGEVKFLIRQPGAAILFADRGVSFVSSGGTRQNKPVEMVLVGSQARSIEPMELLSQKVNYLIGPDASHWATGVAQYGRLVYRQVYPGIDAVFYGAGAGLEDDFVVEPYADPAQIQLEFRGARKIRIDRRGDLLVETGAGTIRQRKPRVYQQLPDGERKEIAGRFVRRGRRAAGFELARYDRSRPLVIDPVTDFATGFGGSGTDVAYGVALDSSGNTYVTGATSSMDFRTISPYQKFYGGGAFDVFVTRFGPDGTMLYSTFIGGSDDDEGLGVQVDGQGIAYVTGFTKSANFPTYGTFARGFGGSIDGFVLALDPSGSKLIYSTYLGGAAEDASQGIVVDRGGNAYVAGFTRSMNFPVLNPYQRNLKGGFDAFVTKLSPGGQILYSTYLGGVKDDAANNLAICDDEVFVTGFALSPDFPATQGQFGGGLDAFIARLDPIGQLTEALFYGGSGDDAGSAIAVSSLGTVTVVGSTTSPDLPVTSDATQTKLIPGKPNGFEIRFEAQNGLRLTSSSYVSTPGLAVAAPRRLERHPAYSRLVDTFIFTVFSNDACPGGVYIRRELDPAFLGVALFFQPSVARDEFLCITAQQLEVLSSAVNMVSDHFSLSIAGATDVLTAPETVPSAVDDPRAAMQGRTMAPTHGFVSRIDLSDVPDISNNGLVNGASFAAGPVSPGEIVTFFGSKLGPPELAYSALNSEGKLDTSAGETMVFFDGVPAPIVYARSDTVSAIVPYSVAGQATTTALVLAQKIPTMSAIVMTVAPSAPAIFTAAAGNGQAALQNADGSYNSSANPASIDSIVAFYATGEGQTDPAGVDGKLAANPGPKPVLPLSVTIGGQPAEVVYSGGAPGQVAGLMQVNVRVPKGIAAGPAVPLVLTVGTSSSQAGVTLAVRE